MKDTIRVATLNLRNASDRWLERAPLLLAQFVELAPDVIGVQEIHVPTRQGEWIVRKVNERLPDDAAPYVLHQANKTGFQGKREGIGIMTRLPTLSHDSIDLRGGHRVALRARLRAPDGGVFDFYNTHLHHEASAGDMRLAQARRIIEWMATHDDVPSILVGDLNATPDMPPVGAVGERLRSAYALVHGCESAGTVPTPLNAVWGQRPAKTIDYIFVDDRVRVHDARIVFDRVDANDERLCASDHYGIVAEVSFV
ncbi:MAG: endonuclease/exonuclease/phosphatase family protein [Dehalococcoidia bacterium]